MSRHSLRPAVAGCHALAAALLLLAVGCGDDRTGPDPLSQTTAPGPAGGSPSPDSSAADSAGADSSGATPADSVSAPDSIAQAQAILDNRPSVPGIVFGTYQLEVSQLTTVHTGTLRGGGITESNVLSLLSGARARGARVVLKLCMGRDSYIKNPDGTFSLTKWKALVDRFRRVNLGPYINDGTLVGHFLVDEPQRASRWGGKIIAPATLEAMAQYSKQIWPTLTTFVRAEPVWLASSSQAYRYLDAGWAQYASGKGSAASWVASNVDAARRKGLGLAVGLNVIDGGNGSSGIRGVSPGKWSMSAAEVRSYGSALLSQSYSCAFYNWTYVGTYYNRADIRSSFGDLSAQARAHPRTSCQQ
jgi:hypothetical protein